ncbi:MAG: hypothetical protein R3F59_13950 [Myxococcota bacterium]
MDWTRRGLLAAAGAATLASRIGWAAAPAEQRLVVLLLRGGMDGLRAVPAVGSGGARCEPVADAVALDGTFALHPGLAPLKARWDEGAAGGARDGRGVPGAVALDAQNVLERDGRATQGRTPGG